ncbi:phosphopantetheine-binding protein [Amycolatopsis sp. NPDC049159]|uniref:phosphopantetheine-binding protein n=1 Tax=unclassified Amycolatopsis TaxID=2618356 RepID=UPI00340D8932
MPGHDLTALTLRTASELLESEDLSLEDDFFSAGGDSLLAMHLVGRLARATGQRLRVSLLLENPVLADFAAAIRPEEDPRAR